ncbi:MAG: 30S ribosomal protein S7 [Candidatus Daviesbacteria bacterium]|nr:30S ribosomal protein S7 [Candidatus Daviesbacteria bacterium]
MRTGKVTKREITPDPRYNSTLLSKFINRVMFDGKKSVAQHVVYNALDIIKEKAKEDPLVVFERALRNVAPKMEVRPRRVGGASYQVPVEVRGDRKETLAIRWLIASATAKPNKEFHTFSEKLATEVLDAANNAGGAIKKRDDVLRMANANRAFAHFRW